MVLDITTPIKNGRASRIQEQGDSGLTGSITMIPFKNECVVLQESLVASNNYYFHGKIKRIDSLQIFYIYLVNENDTSLEPKQQYLKTVIIQPGTGWADIEFIFSPFIAFNTILFKLQRDVTDYSNPRYPVIVYQELSLINNLLSSENISSCYKIGVQSRPGFLMCINGEEIRTGKSGIYELKNGFISITFFSAVAAAKDPDNLNEILNDTPIPGSEIIGSKCIFETVSDRIIDSFSLDYMYGEISQ